MEIGGGGGSKRRQMGYLYTAGGSGVDKGDSCVGHFQPDLG